MAGPSASLLERMIDIGGLSLWGNASLTPYIAAALVIGAVCVVTTMIFRPTRLFALLLLAFVTMLLLTPPWFLHYSGLTAAPAALVAGGGVHLLISVLVGVAHGRVWVGVVLSRLLAAAGRPGLAAAQAVVVPRISGTEFGRALADLPGCVATDDASTLIQMNLLRRNVERGCPVQIDLGGNIHVLPHPGKERVSRGRNPDFQRFCLDFYRSHQAVITVKFRQGRDYSARTARIYRSWPELVRIGQYVVKIPQP